MPTIYDNLAEDTKLLPELRKELGPARRADFCVGYFNLRGWRGIADEIDTWNEDEQVCRVLIGMQARPEDELRELLRFNPEDAQIDLPTARRLKERLAQELRDQLTIGAPTNEDERGLRQLAAQLRAGKVQVKLHTRYRLHAKLYLIHRRDHKAALVGYVGSSNLTFSGLAGQGELNVDVLEQDAAQKLNQWFEDRWNDNFSIDISAELAEIIETSWAREALIPPYHIYLKMAYHLAEEARAGLTEFKIPADLENILFDYQRAAALLAARHLHRRKGVLIGDVVGLGKTLMATTVARIFQEDFDFGTLIICPKNLVDMWQGYVERYRLSARVVSITLVQKELPQLRRYRLVILDESHNLRNREGKRYKFIQEYIRTNDSYCILLSATPYNKAYLDLSAQLRLFVPEDADIGIRPEKLLHEMGELEFKRKHQTGVRTLAAFEKSEHSDDWRELMRLYMVRRTRSFIKLNYAQYDREQARYFLEFPNGQRSYFPERLPKTVKFHLDAMDQNDQYAYLYSDAVVNTINELALPRYGLGQYIKEAERRKATDAEKAVLDDLSRAGQRLIGFTRINLFKRLESSGQVFLQSLERHIVRNYIYIYALENDLPLPVGTQNVVELGSYATDLDLEDEQALSLFDDNGEDDAPAEPPASVAKSMKERAADAYAQYQQRYQRYFKWVKPQFLRKADLLRDLRHDAEALQRIITECGPWRAGDDVKLKELVRLLTEQHPYEKVLIFSQYADTVRYLQTELPRRGVRKLGAATGDSADPTALVRRFSPNSNMATIDDADELRVLLATDVLSEGHNLQDAAIVVNFDLPWAIIRLIQRAGRVDRIGQQAQRLLCYSFLPAEGVEQIIRLRSRVSQRLEENAQVVGTDEAFFEDQMPAQALVDLYSEKDGILDEDDEGEVDLASYAYQIWRNAVKADPALEKTISKLAPVSYSAREHVPNPAQPEGVLLYMRTAQGYDSLAWVTPAGEIITESQYEILNAARCEPNTPARPHADYHHPAVTKAVRTLVQLQADSPGGQLGSPRGARFKTYERLKRFWDDQKGTLFEAGYLEQGIEKAIDDLYRYPLRPTAADTLNRQIRSGISDDAFAQLVLDLRRDNRLSQINDRKTTSTEPQIICSLGLLPPPGEDAS